MHFFKTAHTLAFLHFSGTVPVFTESGKMSVKMGEIFCAYSLRNHEGILPGPHALLLFGESNCFVTKGQCRDRLFLVQLALAWENL